MQVERIDGFRGTKHEYATYLFEALSTHSIDKCTQWLEEGLRRERQTQSRASLVRYPTPPPDKNPVVFEVWDPLRESKQSLSASQSASKQRFEKEVERFLEDLPASEEQWLHKRKSIGLSSADGILRVVDCLSTRQFNDDNSVIPCENKCPNLHDVAESMARRVRSIGAGKFENNICHFMSLVFTATCCVAIHKGQPESSVEVTQRNFLRLCNESCTATSTTLRRYRAAVQWLLQEQQCQFFKRGLGHRAFEIFVNEGKSLRFYTRCPKDPGSNKRFTDKVPLCAAPDEIQASLPLWIPFFVKVNTGWSYTSICEALGTRLLSEEEDFQKFKREYLKLAACHIQEITPARLDQSREGVLPKRISTTGEDAAVETHCRGSDNPRSQAPCDRLVPKPRQADPSCQSSPISPMGASPPSWTGSTTSCSSQEVRRTRFRPINGSKHDRGESTTSSHGPRAKRRKGQGHDGVSNLPEGSRTAPAPLEDLAGRCTGQEEGFPPAAIAHSPQGSRLPSARPTHAGSELSDKPHEFNLNKTLSTCDPGHLRETGFTVGAGGSSDAFRLLIAAVEQDRGVTLDTGYAPDGRTGSIKGFGPRGNPGLMLGAPEQPAGQYTSQSLSADDNEPCWEETKYSMMDIVYDVDDDSGWKDYVDFDLVD